MVSASGSSVTYAVMELGGSLNSRYNAILADGASQNAWPLTGYTYFIIRTNTHLGTCAERKASMDFLYNFYYSYAVTEIALTLDYATLPGFIRNIVVSKLVNSAKCSTGEYALAQYMQRALSVVTTTAISGALSTYLSAYYTIDSFTLWNLTTIDNSDDVWRMFSVQPGNVVAAFTMFPSRATKLARYGSTSGYPVLTSAFAHVAVVPLYHLDTFTAHATATLRVTAEILAGIYTGKIQYWNDTLIQLANSANKPYLPNKRIVVVARGDSTDTNQIFSRYLAAVSPAFASAYGITAGLDGKRQLSYSSVLPSQYLKLAYDNVHVDSFTTFYDGSFGYYLQTSPPIATVAQYCSDRMCSSVISPTLVGSLDVCEDDPHTLVTNGAGMISYDLMFSNASGCYPLVGTVDYSVGLLNNAPTCSLGERGVAHQSVKFGAYLFNGSALVRPLTYLSIDGTPASLRYNTQQALCEVSCSNSIYLGFEYCGYRDCTWADEDYIQVVSTCHASTEQRTVTYVLTPGNKCITNSSRSPKTSLRIDCDHIPTRSLSGIFCYAMAAIGVTFALGIVIAVRIVQADQIFKQRVPMFLYVFILGAVLTNLTIILYVGENTDTNCLGRPWLFNIALSVMYGPLIMKLFAVAKIVHSTKAKKSVLSENKILIEGLLLILGDFIILVAWTGAETPKSETISNKYGGVLANIQDRRCTTGAVSQYVMVAYKMLVLGAGMFKAISTWHVTADISEAKQFSVAIAVGGVAYMMIVFVTISISNAPLLTSVAIFLSGTITVALVMLPRLRRKKSVTRQVHGNSESGRSQSVVSRVSGSRKLSSFFGDMPQVDEAEGEEEEPPSSSVTYNAKRIPG